MTASGGRRAPQQKRMYQMEGPLTRDVTLESASADKESHQRLIGQSAERHPKPRAAIRAERSGGEPVVPVFVNDRSGRISKRLYARRR